MKSRQFDPFNNREARDIRNNLSKAFLRALAAEDASLFRTCGSIYMQSDLPQVYERYVADRLAKYEKAYATIEQGKYRQVLQQAATLWDLELYYEMHEILEPEWKDAAGDRRRALQGLIRAAGMKIHATHNRRKPAVSMAAKALADLREFGGELYGSINLEAVLAEIKQTLAADGREGPAD